jgi:hypothetical protein
MLAGRWYGQLSYVFSREFHLLLADTGSTEKEVAFFDGLRWYATLPPLA